VPWRFLRGFADEELRTLLSCWKDEETNFDAPQDAMTAEEGWNQTRSVSTIGRDVLEKAWSALERYEFSDPRVVRAHFDPDSPLEGRLILLELKVLGFHYVCPVRVGKVRKGDEGRVRGFRIDTVKPHLESGSEWFLLEQDPESGEVRFRIEAAWRLGEFPNLWTWAGFLLFARYYQRAWHRLAHLRMAQLAANLVVAQGPLRGGLEHEGLAMPAPGLHAAASNRRWRQNAEPLREVEEEEVGQPGTAGARALGQSAGGVAALAVRAAANAERVLARRRAGRGASPRP
jgi:uncharacterized protein (UPF0548 family)